VGPRRFGFCSNLLAGGGQNEKYWLNFVRCFDQPAAARDAERGNAFAFESMA